MDGEDVNELITGANALGVGLTRAQAVQLLRHLELVLVGNEVLSLTSITQWSSAVRLHILDSIAVAGYLDAACSSAVDLGSGAGYPGVPLAVACGTRVDLMEPTRKKADFLKSVVADLGGLSGSLVLPLRAEELAAERPAHYSLAVARAVAALPSLVELACPLLMVGGTLVAMKGVPAHSERESGRMVAEMLGMAETGWWEYALPQGGERRTVAQYTKYSEASRVLPRRVGMAQKRPLA